MKKFIFGIIALLAVGTWASVSCKDEMIAFAEDKEVEVQSVVDTITVKEMDSISGGRSDEWSVTGKPIGFGVTVTDFDEAEVGI